MQITLRFIAHFERLIKRTALSKRRDMRIQGPTILEGFRKADPGRPLILAVVHFFCTSRSVLWSCLPDRSVEITG